MGVLQTQAYNTALLEWMNQGKNINEFDAYWNNLQTGGTTGGTTGSGTTGPGGVGNVNLVGTDVLNAAFQYFALPTTTAANLAGTAFQSNNSLAGILAQAAASTTNAGIAAGASTTNAGIAAAANAFGATTAARANVFGSNTAARANVFGSQTAARANVFGAGVSAQGGIDQQLIASQAALRAANAQMKTDAALAAAGDISAMQRLRQTQQFAAQIENNNKKLEIAKLIGSGSLFDNIAAKYASAGFGGLPAIGGALGQAGGISQVFSPTDIQSGSIADLQAQIGQANAQITGPGNVAAHTANAPASNTPPPFHNPQPHTHVLFNSQTTPTLCPFHPLPPKDNEIFCTHLIKRAGQSLLPG